jgi:hypothetical protein
MATNENTASARCETCGSKADPWGFGIPLEKALEHRLAAVRFRAEMKRNLDRYHTMFPEEKIRLAMDILWDVNATWDNDTLERYPEDMPSFDEYLAEIGNNLYDIWWNHENAA